MENLRSSDPEFMERFERFAFEEVPQESGQQLDDETRHMAILATLGRQHPGHRGAVRNYPGGTLFQRLQHGTGPGPARPKRPGQTRAAKPCECHGTV